MRAVKWPILILVNSFVTLAWDASRSVFRVSVIIVGGVTAIPCDVIPICIAMTCLGHRSRQKFFDNVSTLIVLLAMPNRVKRLLCWPELFNAKWIWTTKFFNYSQVNWQNCKTLTPLTAIWLTSFKPTFLLLRQFSVETTMMTGQIIKQSFCTLKRLPIHFISRVLS